MEDDEQRAVRPSVDEIGTDLWEDAYLAADGCIVEPDGFCEHGFESWLLRMGMI